MILAALTLGLPAFLGITAAFTSRIFREKAVLLLGGATLGIATFATVSYVLSTILPEVTSALAAIVILSALIIPWFWKKRAGLLLSWQQLPLDRTAVVVFVILAVLFSIIAPKLLITRADGLYTGIINAYGDIAWHMANVTLFAEGQTVPPENPIFAGTRLTYPFLTNFLSAILLRTGASFSVSVNLVALLMTPVLITLLYCFTREVTQNKRAALLAALLFLFGGAALGWIRFGGDWRESGVSLVELITHLPARDYSGVGTDEQGFHFSNPTTTLLLPQRAFLFALPLALTILLLLLPGQTPNVKRYLAAGLAAGILPLFHAHTVLALLPVIVSFFIIEMVTAEGKQRETFQRWLLFALPACIIGIPEILYYLRGGSETGSFMRFSPRWMAGEHNFIWYWFINTGLLIPAAVAGLFMKLNKAVKALAVSGLIIFVVANLYLFAPWAWDNFKLFVYFFVFILPLASLTALKILSHSRLGFGGRVAVSILIGLHMLAAALDIWKLALPTAAEWNEWDKPGIEFASLVKEKTQVGETIATAANHNSPIVLSGRPRYLGFAAHVWSHGGDPWQRENALKEFYEGRIEHTQLPDIIPDYVVVGPHERSSYQNLVIRPTWQIVVQHGDYTLYRL